ncbi:MAG: hypothetical protein A6F72_03855 [Cycloclasticus sp. symbiont of Poecilosclerida sp. N]|nr:MAG: hypothetical protein A6F72_03855 [Cycloclasticus sp. symbiont of Poecilosclerida sp. N]
MRRFPFIALAFLLLYVPSALAEKIKPTVVPEPPELPAQIVSGESMASDITITRKKKEDMTEYSVNGSVYMVKISPKNAPAYYLVDTDGDGSLETPRYELENGINIPQWLLLSW